MKLKRYIYNQDKGICFDMKQASIKYKCYLTIPPEGINYSQQARKKNLNPSQYPIVLKTSMKLMCDHGDSYIKKLTASEITRLLEGKHLTLRSKGYFIDVYYEPFERYKNQKRPTVGKTVVFLSEKDPAYKKLKEEEEEMAYTQAIMLDPNLM